MHEYGIAVEIVRICEETMRAENESENGDGSGDYSGPKGESDSAVVRKLETVRVLVGELSSVEPDLLVFAWEAAVADTALVGSRLEVVWNPARQYCESCCEEVSRTTSEWHPGCLKCGAILRVDGGDELDVLDLAIEEETP